MSQTRNYIDNAPQTTLVGGITNTANTVTVSSLAGWPAVYPYSAVLDIGTASAEVVLVTDGTGTTLTITRSYDGSGALSHAGGATFDHAAIAKDYQEANSHVNSLGGVHGVAGALVGTTDVQTLSGKTLVSPTITGTVPGGITASGTVTAGAVTTAGTVTAGGVSTGGNVTATGDVTGAHVKGILQPTTFATIAARDAAITSPVAGMTVFITADPTYGAGQCTYDGSKWMSRLDTGWQTCTDLSGYNGTLQVRRIGDITYYEGIVNKTSNFSGATVAQAATLPSTAFAPMAEFRTQLFGFDTTTPSPATVYVEIAQGSTAINIGYLGTGNFSTVYFAGVSYANQ